VLAIPWLVFLPNAPYLVTDLVHLREGTPVPIWVDAAMLSAFAGAGLLLGAASLLQVTRLARELWGPIPAAALAIVVTGLVGVGIYIGRFLRWNSWDLATDPLGVAGSVASAADCGLLRMVGVVVVYGGLLLVAYGSLSAAAGSAGGSERSMG
jgi:uncharacterized membrane protein